MKAKVIRGGGARGVCSYVLNDGKKKKAEKEVEFVGGNMCSQDLNSLVREFSITKKMRQEIIKPYYHLSLSCPSGEKLSSKKWDKIAKFYLNKMNIDTDKHQYFVVRHGDTKFDHVHIVTSRIGLDGSVVHGKNDVFTAIKATQEIEKRFKLTPTPGFTPGAARKKKKLTSAEIEKANRTGEAPARAVLQNIIDDIFNNSGNLSCQEFFELMRDARVQIRPNIAKTGRMNGLAFEYAGIYFKGSQLGSDYAWKNLIKRGVMYDENRDSEFLRKAKIKFDLNKSDRTQENKQRSFGKNSSTEQAEQRNSSVEQSIQKFMYDDSEDIRKAQNEDFLKNLRNECNKRSNSKHNNSNNNSTLHKKATVVKKTRELVFYDDDSRDLRM
jgi:hypothetical protein